MGNLYAVSLNFFLQIVRQKTRGGGFLIFNLKNYYKLKVKTKNLKKTIIFRLRIASVCTVLLCVSQDSTFHYFPSLFS